ncbi:flagellar hook-associated protein FlgK [Halobacillus salinarum]|uniref:Flagellar hook-associated protein 1 n=1 Tax=Halobacillus salinarum TaxID=2932257 RepID=A0ABY4EMP2_9BACI|nr:flagellar hook-associated protein FlgK [Halobacillus salinarum]UOQ45726.1 flagellar hook-associated protein FlgK [Halobacillus salinarum]
MVSTFHGLEVAKRGLFTQQSALYTTGHNIANANTPGYTRQRVNFEQTSPFPAASRNRAEIPGQIGTGVQAGSIERVRTQFLDDQYRGENNRSGYYEAMSNAMSRLEQVMNEPSDNGLAKTMDRFWQSLQDLSVNPEDSGARSVVRQRGKAVAETFNYLANTITTLQKDVKNETDVTTKEINSLASQINSINKQISEVEPHGYVPNDLYDERDRLIDQLSGLANIDVSYEETPSSADPLAMGKATISLVDENGQALTPKATLVDGAQNTVQEVKVNYSTDNPALVSSVSVGSTNYTMDEFSSPGKLRALMDVSGYENSAGETVGVYSNMLHNLDTMATSFVNQFNSVQQSGESLNTLDNNDTPPAFFSLAGSTLKDGVQVGLSASLDITDAIKNDLDNIAASDASALAGNGDNAQALADVKEQNDPLLGEETNLNSFYEALIGGMAVDAQEASRLSNNSQTLRQSVEESRMSVSSVSLDEEMTNMIKYQHAYNAAARNITAVDEMIDRIINQMGRVGR